MFFVRNKRYVTVFALLILIIFVYCIFMKYLCRVDSKYTSEKGTDYLILIYIDEKKLYLFKSKMCIKEYPIASGRPEWPSPLGDWRITNKGDWGEGFGGYWMGLNVKWGSYGIHGTTDESSIGRAESHGCIRMFNEDIKELYNIVPVGTSVIIRNGCLGPFGTGFRELIPGDRGSDVLAVQQRLHNLGYFNGYDSGIYEDDLKFALHKFQEANSLEVKNSITREDYDAMGFKEFE